MKRTVQAMVLAISAAEVLVVGQGTDAAKILAGVRAALGGDARLSAVKTVAIDGQSAKAGPDGQSVANDFEMAIELPDKFMKKDVMGSMGGAPITRRSGFNGGDLIEEIDAPPAMGGGMHMIRMGPSAVMPGGHATPEAIAAQRAQSLAASRREFARLALGMFASSFSVHPLDFSYAGQAESSDGKADVIGVTGPDGFSAKLFIDSRTRLPLMLSWMDKEPIRMTVGGSGGQAVTGSASSPQDMEKLQQEIADRMKALEANRRTVEFRLFYGDYRSFDGIQLPTRIQKMTDGVPTEELTFEHVKVNGKIDPAKFAVAK
jgi:hypothetical protein